jgi:enoyl-CoA hydratase/carnithine racemase
VRPEPESTPALRPAEALDLLGHGLDTEAVGPLTSDRSILVVHADPGPDLDALVAIARDLPCVTVGVAAEPVDDAPDLDVLVCARPDPPPPWVAADVAPLVAAAANAPQAAVVLAQVLRAGEHLDVEGALTLESLAFSTLQTGDRFQRWLADKPARAKADEPEPAVLVARQGERLDLTLNRPTRRNAVDVRLREALVEALKIAAADPSITDIRLRGNGACFSSGGDLDEFGTAEDPATSHLVRTTRGPAWWTAIVADRLTAEVHGACVGAGVELSAFARTVVARPGTTFRLPEVGMGLIPGSGGTASIPRRIGRQRAAYLALSDAAVDVGEALRWGLVDDVID